DVVLATFSAFGVALGALTVYGVATSTGNVTYNSLLQSVVPDDKRGRVFAFYDIVWQAARLLSVAVGGILADALGIRAIYYCGAALLVFAGFVGVATLRTSDLEPKP